MFFSNVSWYRVYVLVEYLLAFWCWCVLFFCLVSRVEFLWLLGCGWFAALRSLVGGVVALLHCAWLVVFVVFCSTYFEFIIVSCVIFVLQSCVVILSVPVVCVVRLFSIL